MSRHGGKKGIYMFSVYILISTKTGKFYIGCTNDINRRLKEHDANQIRSLKNKGPFKLIYKEDYNTLSEARNRELKIKSYKGGNAFKRLIKRD